MHKVGVVLSGCGVNDGAEIHESVLTLLALDRAGAQVQCYAPDVSQHHVVNHVTGEETNETRNVLVESARIARGEIKDLAEAKTEDLDAIVFPGGFGAAKNLCNFAQEGPDCTVNPEVERILRDMHEAGKPIGLACIAPVIGAKVLGTSGVHLTIGNDAQTASAIEKMGARHEVRPVDEICEDEQNLVVSTPAYMLAESIREAALGLEKMVSRVLEMAGRQAASTRS